MCDCKRDWLWVRSSLEEMKYIFEFSFSFLRSGVDDSGDKHCMAELKRGVKFRYAISPEFDGKWKTGS